MTTLIHTPCSRRHKLMDSSATALGWAGFAWLCAPDSVAHASVNAVNLNTNAVTLFSVTLVTCSASLMAWSVYNKWLHTRGRTPDKPASATPVDDLTLAAHFAVEPEALDNVHSSRRTTIYHTEEGDIVEMKTDNYARPRLRLIA